MVDDTARRNLEDADPYSYRKCDPPQRCFRLLQLPSADFDCRSCTPGKGSGAQFGGDMSACPCGMGHRFSPIMKCCAL